MKQLTLISPAKVNLFLKIVSKRTDGYHNLASLFQAIDLHDTLHFTIDPTSVHSDSLTCTDSTLPTDASNLILKAANLFRKKTSCNFQLTVHLEKRIPHQAGLGGGSSNAATTLWALNQFYQCPATPTQLMHWAGEIGSDISFFLSEGTAYCTGRGEILECLPPFTNRPALTIVKPPQGLSTPEVFKRLDLKTILPREPRWHLEEFFRGNPTYFNDLEIPAFAAMPVLATLKEQLLAKGFSTVLLCGSGSSLFCLGKEGVALPSISLPPLIPMEVKIYESKFINRVSGLWYGST